MVVDVLVSICTFTTYWYKDGQTINAMHMMFEAYSTHRTGRWYSLSLNHRCESCGTKTQRVKCRNSKWHGRWPYLFPLSESYTHIHTHTRTHRTQALLPTVAKDLQLYTSVSLFVRLCALCTLYISRCESFPLHTMYLKYERNLHAPMWFSFGMKGIKNLWTKSMFVSISAF